MGLPEEFVERRLHGSFELFTYIDQAGRDTFPIQVERDVNLV